MSELLFSNEPEVAYLSILLKHPELLYNNSVKPFMLSSIPNKLVLETIIQLSEKNLLPEVNLLESYLDSINKLDTAGGIDYIKYLYNQQYSHENIKGFESLIIRAYKSRMLLSLSAQVPSLISSGNPDDIINNLKNNLENLCMTSGGESTSVLSNLLKEGWEEIIHRVENPGIGGNPFAVGKKIDIITGGVGKGDVWLIAGRPSMGKTAIICNSLLNTALLGNVPLIFSLEMNKQAIIERLIAVFSKLSVINIRLGNLTNKDLNTISKTIESIKNLPIHIDTNYNSDINYIESTIRKYQKLHNVNMVYLDYLQLLVERDESATNELGKVIRRFKLVSNDLGISSILLSQINREVERRDDKRPILSDLRQSGNLEEDADLVAFLYRDEYYHSNTEKKNGLEFIIRKHRHGPVGTINLAINKETNYISDDE